MPSCSPRVVAAVAAVEVAEAVDAVAAEVEAVVVAVEVVADAAVVVESDYSFLNQPSFAIYCDFYHTSLFYLHFIL